MGKLTDYYPSTYLKAEDLDGQTTVTIKQVKDELFTGQRGQPDQTRPVVHFRELKKPWVVNRTNFAALCKITGEDTTDGWVGARVQLRVDLVQAFGGTTDAIRVYPAPQGKRVRHDDDTPDWVTDPD